MSRLCRFEAQASAASYFCYGPMAAVKAMSGVVLVTRTCLRSCIANVRCQLVVVQIHHWHTKALQLGQK